MLGPSTSPKLTEGERIAVIAACGVAAAAIVPALINVASEAIKAWREARKPEAKDA